MYAVYPAEVAVSDEKMKMLSDSKLCESKIQHLILDHFRDNPTENPERKQFRKKTRKKMNFLRDKEWNKNPTFGCPQQFKKYIRSRGYNFHH